MRLVTRYRQARVGICFARCARRGSHLSVSRLQSSAPALVALVTLAFVSVPAQADVTSWLAVGPGYAANHNFSAGTNDRAGALTYSLGVGSDPLSRFVFGGILRGTTFFSQGTDLSLSARGASGGFARGDWGIAVDVGVVGRWWGGGAYGSYPMQLIVTGGMPWGLQVGIGSDFWSISGDQGARGFFGVLEIDLMRLTLMRQGSTERFWRNPSPAGGHLPKASE